MKIGRIYFALSSLIVVIVVFMVMVTNAIPTTAYPTGTETDNTSSTKVETEEPKESFEGKADAEKMIAIGKSLIGTNYCYTGKTEETGFDCSGFTHYIFKQVGIELSPASKEQIFAGRQVEFEEARKGDLLVFTGTNLAIREPGHVGIVITEKGENPVKFVHSSSNGGVKISDVQGTRYAQRLLQVRRLLD
ncbi:MAG: C40 family peptidase [Bacteroidia bacterium]